MLRTGKTAAIVARSAISAPPPFRRLHCSGQKRPNSLCKQNQSDTTAAGCVQFCRARPCTHRVAARALRSAVVESEKFGMSPQTRKTKRALRRRWHGGTADATLLTSLRGWASALLSRMEHNTHCPFGRAKTSHINSFRADTPRSRDPSARNLCQTMWHCVPSGCFTVTLTADPHLRARAGSHRASLQASGTPTPPRRC